MLKQADVFILLAVGISFAVSGFLWFSGQREEGCSPQYGCPRFFALESTSN